MGQRGRKFVSIAIPPKAKTNRRPSAMKRSRKNRLARQKLRFEVEGVPPNAHTSVMMNPTMGMLKTISESIQSPTETGFSSCWLESMRETKTVGLRKPIANTRKWENTSCFVRFTARPQEAKPEAVGFFLQIRVFGFCSAIMIHNATINHVGIKPVTSAHTSDGYWWWRASAWRW